MATELDPQAAVENAFAWVHRVYRESRLLLNEVTELFSHAGFQCWDKSGKPYAAQGPDTTYLLAHYYSTPEEYDAPSGIDAFVAVSLYPDVRHRRGKGPRLIVGTVERSIRLVPWGVNLVNFAARAPAADNFFQVTSARDDHLVICTPTAAGQKAFAGAGTVRSLALRLTAFSTPDNLNELVEAILDMRRGEDGPARALLARTDPI